MADFFGKFKYGSTSLDSLCIIMRSSDENGANWDYMITPFFPESISDSKSVNWNNIELPGSSHPIYQFIAGGERTVSFTVKLLRETRPIETNFLSYTDKRSPFNIDINKAVKFLKSCLYPQFANPDVSGATVVKAPPICKIKCGGNDFGHNKGGMMTCIMTQCDVETTKWWDDAKTTPRIADVSLSFSEIINVFGSVNYIQSSDIR